MSLSNNINPSLALIQPRKTRPYITERLLIGSTEQNQAKIDSHLQGFRIAHGISLPSAENCTAAPHHPSTVANGILESELLKSDVYVRKPWV